MLIDTHKTHLTTGAPEEVALLSQALLKSPNKRLSLLPEGEASIERTREVTLKDGAKTRRVVLSFRRVTLWPHACQ